MSYTITRSTPDTPWLINALLALRHAHLAERWGWVIPESLYCEWWYADYGSVLTYEVEPDAGMPIKWTVDFADEKEYLMFLLRWS